MNARGKWEQKSPHPGTCIIFVFLTLAHNNSQTQFIKCEPEVLPTPRIPSPSAFTYQTQQSRLQLKAKSNVYK